MFVIAALLLNVHSALVDVSIQQHRLEIVAMLEEFRSIDYPMLRKETGGRTAKDVSSLPE